jgi:hypothetical protein
MYVWISGCNIEYGVKFGWGMDWKKKEFLWEMKDQMCDSYIIKYWFDKKYRYTLNLWLSG